MLRRRSKGECAALENPLVILVVEDDHLIQSVVEAALADGGFEIVLASSGEQAMELLDSSEGKFRALVTDINLGRHKLNGWWPVTREKLITTSPSFI
jgi:DNA-binding NtrC family response regulator